MVHIVILGAGIGGVSMAYDMRAAAPKARITVISDSHTFHFVPSNPWVAVKWRSRREIEIPLRTYLASWNAICLADMGNTGVAFVALPQNPPRNVAWMKGGAWVHYLKLMFEWYFLRKVRKGTISPFYETYLLKLLGISKRKAHCGT